MYIADEDRQSIVAWAEQTPTIAEVWLYGSRARGDHCAESDIDLAIVTAGRSVTARHLAWTPETWRGDLHLSKAVHLEWFDPDTKPWLEKVAPAVERDGVLVYRRP